MAFRRMLASGPFARLAALPIRARAVTRYMAGEAALSATWLLKSREHHNYTYDLTARNISHLAHWVSLVTGAPATDCVGWINEILSDSEFVDHITAVTLKSDRKGLADREVRIARRAGWYAVVRAVEPEHVVETGTDKGLGSVVIAAALLKNGHGRLTTIDINSEAGYLLGARYATVADVVIGDSVRELDRLEGSIDLFIHDSDHSPEHESNELASVTHHLTPSAIVLSDNAHATDSLMAWADATGRRFTYFQERPARHWYRGAGIGAAWLD